MVFSCRWWVAGLFFVFLIPTYSQAATIVWDNTSGDGLWSTCTNWATDACPGSADTVSFDGTNDTDSYADTLFTGTVDAISIAAGYTGTTTIQRSLTLDNSGGFSQAGGKVKVEGFNISLTGDGAWSHTGGEFHGTSTTITLERNITIDAAALMTLSNGTTTFSGSVAADDSTLTCTGSFPGLVNIAKTSEFGLFSNAAGCNITLVKTSSTAGDVTFNGNVAQSQSGSTFTISGGGSSGYTLAVNGTWDATGLTGVTLAGDFTVPDLADLVSYTATTTFNGSDAEHDSTLTCTGSFPGLVSIAKTIEYALFNNAAGCNITLVKTSSTAGDVTFNGNVAQSQSGSTFTISGGGSSGFTLTVNGTWNASGLSGVTLAGNMNIPDLADLVSYTATTTFDGGDADNDSTLTCTGSFPGLVSIAKTSEFADFNNALGCNITLVKTVSTAGSVSFIGDVAQSQSGSTFTISGGGSTGGVLTVSGTWNASGLTGVTLAGNYTVADLSDLVSYTATTTFNGSDNEHDTTLTCTGSWPGLVSIAKTSEFAAFNNVSGCNITLVKTSSTAGDVTFTGNVAQSQSGSTFTISGGGSSGYTLTVNGTWDATGLSGVTLAGNMNIPDLADLSNYVATTTFNGSDADHDSTLTCTGSFPGLVSIAKTSEFALFNNAAGCNITLVKTSSTAGDVTFNGNVAQSQSGSTFAITGGGSSGYTLTVNGTWDATGLTGVTLAGSMTVPDLADLVSYIATTTFNGSDADHDGTLSCTGTFPAPLSIARSSVFADFTLGSGCTASINAANSTSGRLTVNGTLNLKQYSLTVGSTFTVASGGTLGLYGDNSTLTTPTLSAGSTVDYNGSGTYSSLKAGNDYSNLVFSGAGSWTAFGDMTLGQGFKQTAGTFTSRGTLTFNTSSSATATTTANTILATTTANLYLKVDEGSGVTAVDSSGNSNNGTLANMEAADWSTTDTATLSFTNAASLGTNADNEVVTLASAIDIGASWTVSSWFKWPLESTASWNTLFRGGSADHPIIVQRSNNALGTFVSSFFTSGYDMDVLSSGWHHIAAVGSGSQTEFFIDGVSVGTAASKSTTDITYVGNCGACTGQQWGRFDDVRVYSEALSSTEISTLASGEDLTPVGSVVVNKSGGTLTLAGSGLSLSGDLTLTAGTLDASTNGCSSASCSISLAGDWLGGNELFTPRTGTVTLNGTNQSITGTSTFYNLSKTVSSADTLTFGSNQTQTVQGTWTATGQSGAVLTLAPSVAATQWKVDPQSTRTLSYVSPSYSNNTNATAIQTAGFNMTDGGNNTNWQFNLDPDVPTALGPSSLVGGSDTTDPTPTVTFSLSDSDSSDTLRYHIQIDDSSDFSSPIVDYLSARAAQGSRSFTVGQAVDGGSYTSGNANMNFSTDDTSLYWRVRSSDGTATSSYTTANSGAVAFVYDSTPDGDVVGGGFIGGGGGGPAAPIVPFISSASASASLLLGPSQAEQGDTVTLVVLARNLYKANTKEGGDSVKMTITGANPATITAIDENDGTYTVRYIAANQGTDKVTATLNGSSVGHDSDGKDDGTLNIKISKRTKPLPKPPPPPPEPEPTPEPEPLPPKEPVEPLPPFEPGPLPEPTEEPPPVPQSFQSGLTTNCFRAFTWDGNAPTSIYRKIGSGHDDLIARLNPKTTWFIDIDPIENQPITYRINSPRHDEVITFSAGEIAACTEPATPPLVIEEDVDGDGEMEQYIDGVYQDADGSSSPIALAEEGILIDTNDNGGADTYWLPGGEGTSLVVAAGDRLFILEGTLSGVQMFAPLTNPYYRVVLALSGAHVALAADAAQAMPLFESFGIVSTPPVPEGVVTTAQIVGAAVAPLLLLFGWLRLPFSLADLGSLFAHLYALIAGYTSSRRRRYPWGTVYNSVSKAPLDPAYVELLDTNGTLVSEAYTDLDGRYGFLAPPGTYRLRAQKTHLTFPSSRLQGQAADIVYTDLTFGEPFTVAEGGTIVKNIPLDPYELDWNELAKKERGLMRFYRSLDPYALMLLNTFFYGGFVFSLWSLAAEITLLNGLIALGYSVLLIVRLRMPSPKLYGEITDRAGNPLSYAIVRVYSLSLGTELMHKVTDASGRYFALVGEDRPYRVTIERRTGPETYEKVYEQVLSARKGLINKRVVVE